MKHLILKPAPPAGEGNHAWLYYAACRAVDAGFTDEEAAPILVAGMSRPPQPTEIVDVLNAARNLEKKSARKWPKRNIKKIAEIRGGSVPVLQCKDIHAETALKGLFPDNPLLCIGKTSAIFNTKSRLEWGPQARRNSLIVPSPMSKKWGSNLKGEASMHCLDNTGPRKYLVVEFDWGDKDTQMQLGSHLAHHRELNMVVFSGGKSHHFWFHCPDGDNDKTSQFFHYAVSLGADPRTWLRSQFVRMPGGVRDTGARQSILFFRPPNQ